MLAGYRRPAPKRSREALNTMRMAEMRLRIAAVAGAAILAVSLGAASAPAAHASSVVWYTITQQSSGTTLEYDGSPYFFVYGELQNPLDPTGTPYKEYESVTPDGDYTQVCLQANVADTTLSYGGCLGNVRQFFLYDNATLFINYYYYGTSPYRCEAYVTGSGDIAMGAFEGSEPNDAWSINPVTIES
jgi:hypothetical protein